MKKISVVFFGFFFIATTHVRGQSTNYIFALDNSGSMSSKGVEAEKLSVWKRTQKKVCDFIMGYNVKNGDAISIYYFNMDLSPGKTFSIKSDKDKKAACKFIYGISADGMHTCIYNSVYKLFENIHDSVKGKKIIYVLTDSIESCPDIIYTAADIKRKLDFIRSTDFAYLYFISLKPEAEFPDLTFLVDSIIVDFSNTKFFYAKIPVRTNNVMQLLNSHIELQNINIQLADTITEVKNDTLLVKFKINENYYSGKKETGSIYFYQQEEQKNNKQYKLKAVFIMPSKRKVKITFN